VRWPSYPPTPSPKKGIRCHHFGQHYEIYSICKIYSTTLQQSTWYINPDICIVQWNKLVHHKLLLKNYHDERLITSRCKIFPSFYFPTNQFRIQTYKAPKYNPDHIAHLNLAPNNLITLTWHDN